MYKYLLSSVGLTFLALGSGQQSGIDAAPTLPALACTTDTASSLGDLPTRTDTDVLFVGCGGFFE